MSRNILYRSIDEALGGHRFNINIAIQHDQARKAVQDALLRAQVIGKDQALAYQRLQTVELRAAQAELAKLKAAHMNAADAAKAHSGATKDVGNSLISLTGPINEVKSMLANLWSIQAAKEFLSQVIEIGSELEHQKDCLMTHSNNRVSQTTFSRNIRIWMLRKASIYSSWTRSKRADFLRAYKA